MLVAPDSFKGTFPAAQVACAMADGLRRSGVHADTCPLADGGEGTMATLVGALGGDVRVARVHDPLGRSIDGRYALLGDRRTAIVEVAEASGLLRLGVGELDPWAASTYGTGQLLVEAAGAGATAILVAAGGSATVDGGAGALEAVEREGGIGEARIVVLCDVRTPWERAAEVFGPQKGADVRLVQRLATRLDEFASRLPRDPRGVPMTGAAGALSGGLWASMNAQLAAGAPYLLQAVDFDARLRRAAVVLTGEGRLDGQTSEGKLVGEIAARARTAGVPVHALVGVDDLPLSDRQAMGLESVTAAGTLGRIADAAFQVGRSLLRGR